MSSKTLCDHYTISSKNRIELTPKIPLEFKDNIPSKDKNIPNYL